MRSHSKHRGPYTAGPGHGYAGDAPRVNEKSRKLSEYGFFSGTSPKFVEAIGKMLEKETFEKQDYLFKEGETGFNLYLISSGSVIICSGCDINEVEILSRGRHCGDLALLGTSRRTCNAIAREHTECLVLRNRHFQAILERFPEEKEYFGEVAKQRRKELRHLAQLQRLAEAGARQGIRMRPKRVAEEDDDSDRDATDDPAPKLPCEEAAPLPDTEIPGAYPKESKMTILDLAAPPRHGPEQLVPLKIPEPPEQPSRYQARMGKELASVGRAAFARKMAVAEALSKEMAPMGSSSMRPMRPQSAASAAPNKKVLEEIPKMPPAIKKALQDDDDDGFDVNFDLNNIQTDFNKMDLNAVDPWRRAVSA